MSIDSDMDHASDMNSTVYRAVNGSPGTNLAKVIDLMGGMSHFIGADDIVVIKPNFQWWNHGAPNLSALQTLVDLIIERPGGFSGEVVIAENCHRGSTPWTSQNNGWVNNFLWNSDIPQVKNANDLVALLKRKYKDSFSFRHWLDIDAGGKRVYGPKDGEGYVFCDGTNGMPLLSLSNGCIGKDERSTIMTYPVFLTDRGTTIDFKNGIWEDGSYSSKKLRFINLAALNHHSTYCGMTSAVKNYLGITDISGGADPFNNGRLTDEYYNFHSFCLNKWSPGPVPGMLGAEVGVFMNTIRRADLNIITAEWTGLSSRTIPPIARTRAVLASEDPVALDYHAAKYILYPNSKIPLHDPDNKRSPSFDYLKECSGKNGGIMGKSTNVTSYDFLSQSLQKEDDLVIHGDILWKTGIKQMAKYIILRSNILSLK